MIAYPVGVGFPGPRVYYHEPMLGASPEYGEVVDYTATIIEQIAVPALSNTNRTDRQGDEPFQIGFSRRSFKFELTHVTSVKNGCKLPGVGMLIEDSIVLNRHLPAGEGGHSGAQGYMDIMEWGYHSVHIQRGEGF